MIKTNKKGASDFITYTRQSGNANHLGRGEVKENTTCAVSYLVEQISDDTPIFF